MAGPDGSTQLPERPTRVRMGGANATNETTRGGPGYARQSGAPEEEEKEKRVQGAGTTITNGPPYRPNTTLKGRIGRSHVALNFGQLLSQSHDRQLEDRPRHAPEPRAWQSLAGRGVRGGPSRSPLVVPSPTHCLSPSPERKRIVTSTRTREQRPNLLPLPRALRPALTLRGRGDSARRGSARPARSIPSGLGLDPGDDLDPRLERFRPRPSTFRRSRIRPFCAATAPSSRRHVPPTISAMPMGCDMPTMSDMRRLATRRRLVCHASVFIVLGIKRHLGALIGWIIACLG